MIAMLTAGFWLDAADRAMKSFAQALLLLWGSTEVFNILDVEIGPAFGIAAGAAVLSILTSIVSAPAGDKDSPSLFRAR